MSSERADEDRTAAWLETPDGKNAEDAICRLLRSLLSDWPRRGSRLLHAGCGASRITGLFWEAGFDVTGLTASPALLEKARAFPGPHADVQLGAADSLPYDDNSFEFVVLAFLPGMADGPLAEAFRVATQGILAGFLNSWSMYGVLNSHSSACPPLHSPCNVWRSLRATAPRPQAALTFRSVLPLPSRTWKDTSFLRALNTTPAPDPVGAYAAFRADLGARPAMTPLTLGAPLLRPRSQNICLLSKR